ncbi:MAG TPA: ABC transporter permease [Vicinamibacterales bacterium]|nr:ABC transporter permease [Vicinamibacterales bacterium]
MTRHVLELDATRAEGALPHREGHNGHPSPMSLAVRACVLEAKYELLKALRMPAFAIPAIVFPAMFYVLFGVAFGSRGVAGLTMPTYLLATYGAFGVIGASLFAFGVGVAVERGHGWLTLKRATPMPPASFLLAKLAMCALFSVAIVALLATLGVTLGGVRLAAPTWTLLMCTLVAGAVPFCALGLALGLLVAPSAAAPIANLVYLPMAFASGLWIPLEALPAVVRSIAPWLPAYHLAQLALKTIGGGADAPVWSHVAALLGFALAGLGVALYAYRRQEE